MPDKFHHLGLLGTLDLCLVLDPSAADQLNDADRFQGSERDTDRFGPAVERSRVILGPARHRLAGAGFLPEAGALGLAVGSSDRRNADPVDKRCPLALALLAPPSAANWEVV